MPDFSYTRILDSGDDMMLSLRRSRSGFAVMYRTQDVSSHQPINALGSSVKINALQKAYSPTLGTYPPGLA